MTMSLWGESWLITQEDGGLLNIDIDNLLSISDARELAIALDKIIEHMEGQANAE